MLKKRQKIILARFVLINSMIEASWASAEDAPQAPAEVTVKILVSDYLNIDLAASRRESPHLRTVNFSRGYGCWLYDLDSDGKTGLKNMQRLAGEGKIRLFDNDLGSDIMRIWQEKRTEQHDSQYIFEQIEEELRMYLGANAAHFPNQNE
ncbi:MAG: hypothetical protein LBJ92_01010 [Holosporales bacterium]|jgi:hypothetical protein|nr:hypothetical protein [Holosporales bacterium]